MTNMTSHVRSASCHVEPYLHTVEYNMSTSVNLCDGDHVTVHGGFVGETEAAAQGRRSLIPECSDM